MRTLTKQEANRLIAEKVMGWRVRRLKSLNVQYSDCYANNLDIVVCVVDEYEPTTDANQANKALETWAASRKGHCVQIFTGWSVNLHDFSDEISPCEGSPYWNSVNKSLTIAICEALCSAALGEQIKIEE